VKKIVPPNNHGFTLLELMVVIAIVGIIASIATVAYNGYIETTRIAAAKMQIRELSIVLNDYALDNGAYPDSLDEIGSGNLLDPWGNPYQYLKFPKLFNGASVSGSEIYSNFSAGYSIQYASYSSIGSNGYSFQYAGDYSGYSDGYNQSYEGYSNESDGYSGSTEQGGGGATGGDSSDNGSGRGYMGQVRKDRNLVPINSYFDLYSKGKDGQSKPPLTVPVSQDDIIYASDGAYIGLAKDY